MISFLISNKKDRGVVQNALNKILNAALHFQSVSSSLGITFLRPKVYINEKLAVRGELPP